MPTYMKTVWCTLLLLAILLPKAKAQLAFEGGLNMANMSIKLDDKTLSTTYRRGANFGVTLDIAIEDKRHLYFQPGYYYRQAGTKIATAKESGEYVINTTEIPLNLVYKWGQKCGPRFFVGGGPFISYNKGGTFHLPDSAGGGVLNIGSKRQDNLTERNFGFGLNAGYIFKKHTYIRVHLLTGFSNLHPTGNDKNVIRTSAAGINLGYIIARCKTKESFTVSKMRGTNHWRGLSKGKYSAKRNFRPRPTGR